MSEKSLKHNLNEYPGLFNKLEEVRNLIFTGNNDRVFKNGLTRLIFQVTGIGTEEVSVNTAREILWEAAGLLLEMEAITNIEFKAIDAIDERLSR